MKIACDLCGKATDGSLLQIIEQGSDILYACPECYLATQGEPPEEQP